MQGSSGSLYLVGGLYGTVLTSSFSGKGAGFQLLHELPHSCWFLPQLLLGSISISAHGLGFLQCTIMLFHQ